MEALSSFLDQPGLPWKELILAFSVGQYTFESLLSFRQYQVLKQTRPPAVLAQEVSADVFERSQAYGRAKARFGFASALYAQLQFLAFTRYNILPALWAATGTLLAQALPPSWSGELAHSLLFFFAFNIIGTVLGLPTSYYSTFILEEAYGFNKQTRRLWLLDLLKAQVLTVVFGVPLLSAFLTIVQRTGTGFVFYLWLFGVVVQVFMITIYPVAILPWFNKLSPLPEGPLKTSVEALARRLHFPLKELYVIDGSKRSAHSNAYFYGLPWSKHIVIYDTLIEKSDTEEVVAVLSHELGHWKLGHTTSLFFISQFHMLYLFALFSVFIYNKSLYEAFGFYAEQPIIIGFILFSDALAPMDTLVKFLMNILSRKFEFQADAFAVKLGYSTLLAKSLIKLQIQNLSTMDADWMYASYHYSHPILPERLKELGWFGDEKVHVETADEKVHKETTDGEKTAAKNVANLANGEKPVKANDREL